MYTDQVNSFIELFRELLSGLSDIRISMVEDFQIVHLFTSVMLFNHIDSALEAQSGTSWHISAKESVSIKELVKQILNIMNVNYNDLVDITDDRLGKDQDYLLDSTQIRETFQADNVNLEDGLNDTILWAKHHYAILKGLSGIMSTKITHTIS